MRSHRAMRAPCARSRARPALATARCPFHVHSNVETSGWPDDFRLFPGGSSGWTAWRCPACRDPAAVAVPVRPGSSARRSTTLRRRARTILGEGGARGPRLMRGPGGHPHPARGRSRAGSGGRGLQRRLEPDRRSAAAALVRPLTRPRASGCPLVTVSAWPRPHRRLSPVRATDRPGSPRSRQSSSSSSPSK